MDRAKDLKKWDAAFMKNILHPDDRGTFKLVAQDIHRHLTERYAQYTLPENEEQVDQSNISTP